MNASGRAPVDRYSEIDLRVVVGRLWRDRVWVAGSIIVFVIAFAAVAFLTTPIYRASIVLVDASLDRNGGQAFGSARGQLGAVASLVGLDMQSSASQAEESLAVLRSRDFTERFIRDHQLMPELFHRRWDVGAQQWKGDETNAPTLAEAFRYFDNDVRNISRNTQTGLIRMDIEWRDPIKASLWANELIARLNAEMRSRAIDRTNASVSYLEDELLSTATVETRQAIARLMEAQISQRMLANVTQDYAFRVVDKAMPPDPADIARPRRLILLALGPVIGLVVGVFAVLIAGVVVPTPRVS